MADGNDTRIGIRPRQPGLAVLSQNVTGPSFVRLTCIFAPNCPVATRPPNVERAR